MERLEDGRRQLQHFANQPANGVLRTNAGDQRRSAIERQHALVRVDGHEAARQAVDDMLIECLHVGDIRRRLLKPGAGRSKALGERHAQHGDGEEPEDIESDNVCSRQARR